MVSIDDCIRLENYLKDNRGSKIGIFDIGTRAVRLLVGPKSVPIQEWRRNTFCNLGQILNLGDDLDPLTQAVDLANSQKMQELYNFLGTLKGILVEYNVNEADIGAIGTAVFRWMSNLDDVLEEIERETGIRVNVLKAQDEAKLTLQAIGHTYPYRRYDDNSPLRSDDVIFLLDQGGGSMEVSFMTVGDSSSFQTHTFDGLGTIALRREFFSVKTEAENDTEWVSSQIEHIQAFIAEKVNEWDGYSEISGRRIHAYGMGAAITNCVQGSNYSIHNQIVEASTLLRDAGSAVSTLLNSPNELATLSEMLQSRNSNQYLEIERLLDRLYGPPVYVRILKKFDLDHLRICGYGLRYGCYVWKYQAMRTIDEL